MKELQKDITSLVKLMEKYNEVLLPPCEEASIHLVKESLNKKFDIELSEEELGLWCFCDGLEWNGLIFYSSGSVEGVKGIVEANEEWLEISDSLKGKIVFGESDMDLYIKDIETRQFLVISKYSEDMYEEYNTYEELVCSGIKKFI